MKLINKAWIYLGIGIVIIALIGLGILYTRQEDEHDLLTNRISTVNVTLPKIVSESKKLEIQLNQLENELMQGELLLNDARSKFPELVESIEYGEALFQIADSHHLVLTGFSASEQQSTNIEGATFLITHFVANLEGELWSVETAGNYDIYINQTISHILAFIHEVTTIDYFSSARIELVNMSLPMSSMVKEGGEPGQYPRPSAQVNITIYSDQDE